MEFGKYVKDRHTEIIFGAVAFAIILLLLLAFHTPPALIIMVMAVFLIFMVAAFLWDYNRKRGFYQQLKENLNDLDKKNLAAEIISEPDFYEGKILHATLYEMGKSMTEQISKAEQSVTDFKDYVEMWVHEAKLPVAALLLKNFNRGNDGMNNGMNDGDDIGSNDAESDQIKKQLMKLDAYTEQILYFTRSEVAEKDFLIKQASLAKIFGSVAARMREELQDNQFDIRVSGLDVQVMTDSKWMEFVLTQLISNSIKYGAEDRERVLEVFAEEKDQQVHLHVRDNGIGISEADLPRIFEKSFTGENGRRREKSTGMGLYIARNLCRKLGHGITAQSVQGEYTEFIITFSLNDYYRP